MRRLLSLSAAVACMFVVGTVAAEPSAGDKESSRQLFAEGMKALEAADYKGAAKSCGAAFKLVPASTPGVCLGRALVGLNKLVEARDVFLAASRYPSKDGEPAVIIEAGATAGAEAEKLAPRIPTLTLSISGAVEAQLRASIDGEDIASETIKSPRRVNPGKHVLVVGADGFADERVEIELAEGEKKRVPIALHASASSSRMPTAGWIAIGVGGAGLIVGSIVGALAFKDKSTLNGECKTPTTCPTSAQGDLDTLRSHTLLSTVGFVIGAVGIGAGIVIWRIGGDDAAPRKETPKTDAALTMAPGWLGLRGRF